MTRMFIEYLEYKAWCEYIGIHPVYIKTYQEYHRL